MEWRCMWKKELRAYHIATHHHNGLGTLRWKLLGTRALNEHVTVVTAELFGRFDVAARLDEDNTDRKASASTAASFIEAIRAQESAPGTSELPGAPPGEA